MNWSFFTKGTNWLVGYSGIFAFCASFTSTLPKADNSVGSSNRIPSRAASQSRTSPKTNEAINKADVHSVEMMAAHLAHFDPQADGPVATAAASARAASIDPLN